MGYRKFTQWLDIYNFSLRLLHEVWKKTEI